MRKPGNLSTVPGFRNNQSWWRSCDPCCLELNTSEVLETIDFLNTGNLDCCTQKSENIWKFWTFKALKNMNAFSPLLFLEVSVQCTLWIPRHMELLFLETWSHQTLIVPKHLTSLDTKSSWTPEVLGYWEVLDSWSPWILIVPKHLKYLDTKSSWTPEVLGYWEFLDSWSPWILRVPGHMNFSDIKVPAVFWHREFPGHLKSLDTGSS